MTGADQKIYNLIVRKDGLLAKEIGDCLGFTRHYVNQRLRCHIFDDLVWKDADFRWHARNKKKQDEDKKRREAERLREEHRKQLEEIQSLYIGYESIIEELLNHNINFSHEGDVDLCNRDEIVIATAGILLKEQKIAIDPVDDDSRQVFERTGYRVVSKEEFNLNMIK